ncbi:MAG TPA: U32 family peptidase, partial [Dongiaceae bacterium]|nr:U32 family peptidase [Dongiaceae bacterium]
MTGTATIGKNLQSAVRNPQLPELLAPAGDWECAKAAVENGADAIYFGLDKFNARMRAHNFTEADLPKLMEFLHRRGVKGYVTFNTLIFQNELADAENYLRAIISAGVDAAIVQDVGICKLIRELSPDFPIHASTQMTISSAAGIEFARDLGCNLAVLARECSIAEIEKINSVANGIAGSNPQSAIRNSQFPLEVFVHGALCVAYSGQCLTSESLGGRSANRGECAQACRMPYDLISDGQQVPLGDKRYLLSPQDLSGLEVLPELVRVGVASLKIEGRLKSPEYVASITRVYRKALDKISEGRVPRDPNLQEGLAELVPPNDRYEVEMSFSRGLFTGWFGGTDNQKLVHARFGKKRGVFLGEVKKIVRDGVIVNLAAPVKPGDGIVFDAGKPDEKEEGGRIYEIQEPRFKIPGEKLTELRFGYGNIDFLRVHVGDKLWKTNDPELDKRLRQSFAGDAPRFQRPIGIEVHGLAGKPLTVIARDVSGNVAKVESTMPLAKAEKLPLTEEKLRDQLGRLGGTPFKLGELKNFLSGEVMVAVSELNRLRREFVIELEKLRAQPKRWKLNNHQDTKTQSKKENLVPLCLGGSNAELIVLVRNLAQLEAALKCGVNTVYCEFEDPKKYREAVTLFHTARGCESAIRNPQSAIFVAPPRITKMGEEWILNIVRSCNADGYLVRNYDHLKFFADTRRVGDFSLNVANRITADYFKNHFGLERLTTSYDLNVVHLDALL